MLNEQKKTAASSDQKYIFNIEKNVSGKIPIQKEINNNTEIDLDKDEKVSRKDNLRATTIRKCLHSINEFIKVLIQRIELKIKSIINIRQELQFWEANIPDTIISNLKVFEKFVKKRLISIYISAKPKTYEKMSDKCKIENLNKIQLCYILEDEIIDCDELRLLKILLALKFSQLLQKYVNNEKIIFVKYSGEKGGFKIHIPTFHTIKDDFQDEIDKRIFVVNELINSQIKHRNNNKEKNNESEDKINKDKK